MALSRTDIQRAFQNALGRNASRQDEDQFFFASESGGTSDAQVYAAISNSQEANLNTDPVVRFYQAAFGRVPDQAGLDKASDYIRANGASAETYQKLADLLVQSPEFQAQYGTGTAVDAAYVQALYAHILGREPSATEIAGYVSGANGYDTRGEVLYAVSQSNEAIRLTESAVNAFLQNAAEGDAVYTGPLSASGTPPVSFDFVAPTVSIALSKTSLEFGQTTQVTFDFSEAVTGFDLSDVRATSGTLSDLAQSTTDPTIYRATYTAAGTAGAGAIALTGRYTDLAGNVGAGNLAEVTVAGQSAGGGNPAPAPAAFSIADITVDEGGIATLIVTRTGNLGSTQSVSYANSDGTAAVGLDYIATAGTLTFLAGDTQRFIRIQTVPDLLDEADKAFFVTLSNPTGGAVISEAAAIVTVRDYNSATAFSIGDTSVDEGGLATFTVFRTGDAEATQSVRYTTASGTAFDGIDYDAGTGVLSFGQGVTSQTFTVQTRADQSVEGVETFLANLTNPTNGATIDDAQAIGTIRDTTVPNVFSIEPVSASKAEGNAETTDYTFKVSRTGTATDAASLTYTVTGSGTNQANATDFGGTLPTGRVAFEAGQSETTLTIKATGDTNFEQDEGFTVVLSSGPTGSSINPLASSANGLITNDDLKPVLTIGYALGQRQTVNDPIFPAPGQKTETYTVSDGVEIPIKDTQIFSVDFTENGFTIQYATGAGSLPISNDGLFFGPIITDVSNSFPSFTNAKLVSVNNWDGIDASNVFSDENNVYLNFVGTRAQSGGTITVSYDFLV